MIVCVTGTPGTGKTKLAKKIAKELNYEYIDVNKVIKEKKLATGYDKTRKCNIIDEVKLAEILHEKIKSSRKNLVIDSHLSHYLNPKLIDLCLVTKCELGELKKRLKKRSYSDKKIKENLECEIMDVCLTEAQEIGHKVKVVFTDKELDVKKIVKK